MKRYLFDYIRKDLQKKMVFIGGPRQVGKTTLSLHLLEGDEESPGYMNYDRREDRKKILDAAFPTNSSVLVFDELHKYRDWRNLVKAAILHADNFRMGYFFTGTIKT